MDQDSKQTARNNVGIDITSVMTQKWALGFGLVLAFDALGVLVQKGMEGWSFSSPSIVGFAVLVLCAPAWIFPRAAQRFLERKTTLCVIAAVGTSSALMAAFASSAEGAPVELRVAASCGFMLFVCLYTLVFFSQFSRLAVPTVISILVACQLLSSLVALGVQALAKNAAVVAILALLPLGAFWCLKIHLSSQGHESESINRARPVNGAREALSMARPVVLFFVVVFAVAIERFFVPFDAQSLTFLGIAVASGLICGLVLITRTTTCFHILCRSTLVFLVAGLTCTVLGGWGLAAAGIMANAAYILFTVFLDALFCDACRRYQLSPYRVFGLLNLGLILGYGAGSLAGSALVGATAHDSALTALVVCLLLVLAFSALITESDYRTAWGTAKLEQNRPAIVDFYANLTEACLALSQQYGLTPREGEVLLLLAQRKSVSEIEADLFISGSTVKSHTKSIYRKLGIHKRDELLALVGHPQANK